MKTAPHITALLLLAVLATAQVSCGESEFQFQQTVTMIGTFSMVNAFQGQPGQPSGMDQSAEPAFTVDFNLAEFSPELQEYTDKGLFKDMRLERLTANVVQNSLTRDLEVIEVGIGPSGLASLDAPGAVLMGYLPVIPAGQTGTLTGVVFEENEPVIEDHVFGLVYTQATSTRVEVPAGEPIPGGSAEVELTLVFTMIADPL